MVGILKVLKYAWSRDSTNNTKQQFMPSNPPSSRRDHSSARTSIDDPVQRKYLPSASKVVMSLDDCSNNSKNKINKSLVIPLLKIEHTTANTYKHNKKRWRADSICNLRKKQQKSVQAICTEQQILRNLYKDPSSFAKVVLSFARDALLRSHASPLGRSGGW